MLLDRNKVLALKTAYFLSLLVAAGLTLASTQPGVSKPLSYQLGQIFGVWSLTILVVQIVLSSRSQALERGVGLPRMMVWHKYNGLLLFLFVLIHPSLLFTQSVLASTSYLALLRSFPWYYWLGELAFVLILLTLVTTIFSTKLKLNYEHWKIIHRIGYLIVVFAFIHSYFSGSDILTRGPLFYWWVFLTVTAGAAVFYHQVVRRIHLSQNWYEISAVIQETHAVRTIELRPQKNQTVFNYLPGQFAFATFRSRAVPPEEHHFTLSSSPLVRDKLSFTIKESGDFTAQLNDLKAGEKAQLEGPFGVFTYLGLNPFFVFIAGGIGITPLMSMLRYMYQGQEKPQTLLIYANKTQKDIVFRDELAEMQAGGNWLRVVHILSQEKTEGFYFGRVGLELLQKEIQDFRKPTFFLVGPPPMMKSAIRSLLILSVPKAKIHTEHFALR